MIREAPESLVTEQSQLEPRGPQRDDADHMAWTSSFDCMRTTPGHAAGTWSPLDGMWLEANLTGGTGFAFAVLDLADGDVVGGACLCPRMSPDHEPCGRGPAPTGRTGAGDQLTFDSVCVMATWFAYEYCTDIVATREFYGELVGLEQIWDEPEDIAFRHDCVQLSFQLTGSPEQPKGWAFQPGWSHGQLPDAPATQQVRSISIALPPAAFRAAVDRLKAAGVSALRPAPFWVGYWSFVVHDPDGNTVELTDPESPRD